MDSQALTVPQLLSQAQDHHRQGAFAEAETLLRQVLQVDPSHAVALHFLGILIHQLGRSAEALELLYRSIQQDPQSPNTYSHLGIVLRSMGRIEEAMECYAQALSLDPTFAQAHFNLGVLLQKQGQLSEAITSYQQALHLEPDYEEAHLNLGRIYQSLGSWSEAEKHYRSILSCRPGSVSAYLCLGDLFQQQEDWGRSMAAYQEILNQDPHHLKALFQIGVIHQKQGHLQEAAEHYVTVLSHDPRYLAASLNLGLLLKSVGQYEQAQAVYQQALNYDPESGLLYYHLGSLYQEIDRLDEASQCYEQALIHQPNLIQALENLSRIQQARNQWREAKATLQNGLSTCPGSEARLLLRQALLLPIIPKSTEEIQICRQELEDRIHQLQEEKIHFDDPYREVGETSFYLAYHNLNDKALQTSLAHLYQDACPELTWIAPHCRSDVRPSKRRYRIGFVSAFLSDHTIGHLNQGLIRYLDRDRFEVIIYRLSPQQGTLGAYIDAAANAVIQLPHNLAAAQGLIAEQEMDILYYPEIGMDPFTYYLAFARLAPLQVVTWGHPMTSGIPNIDYFLSAKHLEPHSGDELHSEYCSENYGENYSENLVTLDRLSVYYEPLSAASITCSREDLGLPPQGRLYVCPQSLFKLHPDNDRLWAKILQADPQGYLVLISGPDPSWQQDLLERFYQQFDSLTDRVLFLPYLRAEEFRQLLKLADAILDPPYFSGGRSSYEAFSLAAPIVTWPGDFLRARITYAQYVQMGCFDLVARSEAEYVQLALRLAQDPEWQAQIQLKIQSGLDSILRDTQAIRDCEAFFLHALEGNSAPI